METTSQKQSYPIETTIELDVDQYISYDGSNHSNFFQIP